MASIKDVAARAGVSVGTVSNVLNRRQLVTEATRERVDAAIAELGFVRNESARQLRAGRSRTLAYLALDASNPFFTDVARGIEDTSRRREGLAVYLCNSDNDPKREAEYLELLLEQRVLGILVTPVDETNPRLKELPALGVPVVMVDSSGLDKSWCSVSVDDVHGGELAVAHLIERGHRRIAFVGGPMSTVQVRERYEGGQSAFTQAGLDPDALTLFATETTNVAEGRRAGERLAALPAAERPSAAFCANDLVALGLLQEMTRQGVSVPDDLAIVGYDDIEFASAAAVPLTSVRQPRHLVGVTAGELLLTESADISESGGHQHQHVMFQPDLVVRASTVVD